MLNIEDFSILTSISKNMLKNYDELNLLKPKWIDDEINCKYYGEDQVPFANKIQILKSMNYSIKDIKNILMEYGDDYSFEEYVDNALESKSEEIYHLKEHIKHLEKAKKNILKKRSPFKDEITIKELPERNIISYRGTINNLSEEEKLLDIFSFLSKEANIQYNNPSQYTIVFHNISEFEPCELEIQKDVTDNYSLDNNLKFKVIPKTTIMSLPFNGEYGELNMINESFSDFLLNNNYELNGKIMVLKNSSKDTNKDYTEICYPIKKSADN